MDLIKALLIGVALVIGLLAIPILLAIVIPLATFIIIVGVVWFLLQVFKEDDEPKKPP